jgi:hypothetical protein
MFVITLKPADSAFARCTQCQNLNSLFYNSKQGDVSIQFNTRDESLKSKCPNCGDQYSFTVGSLVVANSPQASN